jgi:hypothetical protein
VSTITPAVGVDELERAWRAVRAGQFQAKRRAVDGWVSSGDGPDLIPAPVVLVAGAHGWSGTSTTALLIADAAARWGTAVRLVDAAPPARSGFAAAAATEHGVDETGRWRQGNRGPVSVQRLTHGVEGSAVVPVPPAGQDGTVTVVDTGWPITDLLERLAADPAGRSWLSALVRSAPLVLTARASIPGFRHVEAAVEALSAVRGPAGRVVLALLGPGTLPRTLTAAAGPAVKAAQRDQLIVTVPERPALTRAGLTPAPLPRQLQPAGDQLLALTVPVGPPPATPDKRPRRRLGRHSMTQLGTDRKDDV